MSNPLQQAQREFAFLVLKGYVPPCDFPRTLAQAEALEKFTEQQRKRISQEQSRKRQDYIRSRPINYFMARAILDWPEVADRRAELEALVARHDAEEFSVGDMLLNSNNETAKVTDKESGGIVYVRHRGSRIRIGKNHKSCVGVWIKSPGHTLP